MRDLVLTRYQVSPIADANCDRLNTDVVIIWTGHLETARWHASHNSCLFGAGILDRVTDQVDVGFGFGVPCPSPVI